MDPEDYSPHIQYFTDKLSRLSEEYDKAGLAGDYDHARYIQHLASQFEAELARLLHSRGTAVTHQLNAMQRGYLTGMNCPCEIPDSDPDPDYTLVTVKSTGAGWEEVPRENLAPEGAIELQDIMI